MTQSIGSFGHKYSPASELFPYAPAMFSEGLVGPRLNILSFLFDCSFLATRDLVYSGRVRALIQLVQAV
jgi:hypothetical protein